MNIDDLKKAVSDICEILNAVSKLINKQGILSLMGAIAPAQDLSQLDWVKVKAEILDLDASERAQLNDVLKQKLQLQKPEVQAKLLDAVDCLEQVIDLAHYGIDVYNRGKVLVDRVKRLVGAA
jgi:hypothetical protein